MSEDTKSVKMEYAPHDPLLDIFKFNVSIDEDTLDEEPTIDSLKTENQSLKEKIKNLEQSIKSNTEMTKMIYKIGEQWRRKYCDATGQEFIPDKLE